MKKSLKILLLTLLLICIGTGIYICYQKLNKDDVNKEKSEIVDIKVLKEKYNLDYKIPKKYENLFKKYSKVVEANNKLGDYKKHVYDMFYLLTIDSINKHLEENYFLSRLAELSINVNPEISKNGNHGIYYDNGAIVEIDSEHSISTYHELMHFFYYNLNSNDSKNTVWECDNKIMYLDELKHAGKNKKDCENLTSQEIDLINEAGAELYSAKYLKKGVIAYYDIVAYFTAIEYIIGSEEANKLYFGANSNLTFLYLMRKLGYSEEDYVTLVRDLNYYTYPDDTSYTPTGGKAIDSLIDLYKNTMKGDWTDDEEFKYLLKSFLDIGSNEKYNNSKYKDELSKINYKSYDDFLKREKVMLDQLPEDLIFKTTPIPAYIIDDELYFGTGVRKEEENIENKIIYFKYNFETKKVSDLKYNYIN